MKEAKIVRFTEKTFFMECPYCGVQIRRISNKKTNSLNYSSIITCFECKNRLLFVSPNKGPRKYEKVLCPKCKKTKICRDSKTCVKCFHLNRSNNKKTTKVNRLTR